MSASDLLVVGGMRAYAHLPGFPCMTQGAPTFEN
jgi:hypothetical protein